MAGNKKISQLVDGGAGQAGDNFVIERGGVNFKVDNSSISGNPGGLLLDGIVNDMIVKDEKGEVALEQRISLLPVLSFVDNTAPPPTEVNGDIYLLDDSGASHVDWDGLATNTWAKFDGTAGLWKGITALGGFIVTEIDTGDVRYFDPTSGTWELLGAATPDGADTEIQFNNAGLFGASSLFTFNTAFTEFKCDANAVFNEGGNARDFRIEGLSESNLFFLDGSEDRIGIGNGSPAFRFHLSTTAATNTFVISNSDAKVAFGSTPDASHQVFITTVGAVPGGLMVTNSDAVQKAGNFLNTLGVAIVAQTNASSGASAAVRGIASANTGIGLQGTTQAANGVGVQSDVGASATGAISLDVDVRGDTSTGIDLNITAGTTDNKGMVASMGLPGSNNALTSFAWSRSGTGATHYTGDFFVLTEDSDNTGNMLNIIKGGVSQMVLDASGNLGLGTNLVGTNGVTVLSILNGTAPTTDIANGIQIFSDDATVGDTEATLALFTEQAVEAIGTFTPSNKLSIWINGTEYHIQLDAV